MNFLEIRKKFLDFFKRNGHTIVPSSPIIPADDPSLLFANAGMNQFKDTFLGKEKRAYTRATTIQKCVRAGGKHNDLDEVGYTERHLTFFEMMGNFSFGDYFKKEAIQFAWEFLTKEMELPAGKLYPTVFKTDDESFDLWNKTIGISKEKITRLGEKDNFWQMGDVGPCGPCSEILIDRGKEKGCGKSNCKPGCDCERFLEIWNLVFMQYNKQEDGKLIPLKQTGVDTGMGFERLCLIKQDKDNVFEIDLFTPLIKKIEQLTGLKYDKSKEERRVAFRVLNDHVRSSSLIIADGGIPSNEGRGYVLRKIIRRAALFAQKLSEDNSLFPNLAQKFINKMSPIYPELKTHEALILKLLLNEIEKFSESLIQGQCILSDYIEENQKAGKKSLSGNQIFKLYDTFGFPPELTTVIARGKNLSLDMEGFEKEMQKQKKQSGKKIKGKEKTADIPSGLKTKFVGYEKLETKSKILFSKQEGDSIWVLTEESPFYVESGGQASDTGWISINEQTYPVIDLKKVNDAIAAKLSTKEIKDPKTINIKTGDVAHSVVDSHTRINTVKNHTATHLLQAALRQVLNKEIKQAGSQVNEKSLRFDYTHLEGLTPKQIEEVENLVNKKIQEDIEVKISYTTLAKAKVAGVISFFGEKYNPEKVRIVEVPGFSAELCGGSHAQRTGSIGCFKIISETALSSGVRRIVGLTGPGAVKTFQKSHQIIKTLCEKYKTKPNEILEAIEKQQKNLEETKSTINHLKKELWQSRIPQWQKDVKEVGKIPFLFLELEDFNNNELKQICLKVETKKPGLYFIILKSTTDLSKINFLGFLSKKYYNNINLKTFSSFLKGSLDLKGGGSTNLIQGGGKYSPEIKGIIARWIIENQT